MKIIKILKAYTKTDTKIIKFGGTEIEKHEFCQNKSPVSINNKDINKIVVSNKVDLSVFCFQK